MTVAAGLQAGEHNIDTMQTKAAQQQLTTQMLKCCAYSGSSRLENINIQTVVYGMQRKVAYRSGVISLCPAKPATVLFSTRASSFVCSFRLAWDLDAFGVTGTGTDSTGSSMRCFHS